MAPPAAHTCRPGAAWVAARRRTAAGGAASEAAGRRRAVLQKVCGLQAAAHPPLPAVRPLCASHGPSLREMGAGALLPLQACSSGAGNSAPWRRQLCAPSSGVLSSDAPPLEPAACCMLVPLQPPTSRPCALLSSPAAAGMDQQLCWPRELSRLPADVHLLGSSVPACSGPHPANECTPGVGEWAGLAGVLRMVGIWMALSSKLENLRGACPSRTRMVQTALPACVP